MYIRFSFNIYTIRNGIKIKKTGTPDTPTIGHGLVQISRMEESIRRERFVKLYNSGLCLHEESECISISITLYL